MKRPNKQIFLWRIVVVIDCALKLLDKYEEGSEEKKILRDIIRRGISYLDEGKTGMYLRLAHRRLLIDLYNKS